MENGHCRTKWLMFVGAFLMTMSGFLVYLPSKDPVVLNFKWNFTCVNTFADTTTAASVNVASLRSEFAEFLDIVMKYGTPPFFSMDPIVLGCISNKSKCVELASLNFSHVDFGAFPDTLMCFSNYFPLIHNGWLNSVTDDGYIRYAKNNFTIGIFIIDLRPNYWYIRATKESPAKAVLPTNLSVASLNSAHLIIPLDPSSFLWQLERSTFLNCNTTVAEQFRLKNPKVSASKSLITDEQFLQLVYLRDVMYNWKLSAMLFGGTLLGWYRECDIIPYTTDIDVLARSSEYSVQFEKALIRDQRLTMYWILGKPSDSLEMSTYGKSVKLDIFFLYEEKDHSWVGGMYVPEKKKLRWTYPTLSQGICSADLKGHLFMVPCNVVEYLTADYGLKWYEPVNPDDFVWYKSHQNVASAGKWSLSEWPTVYRTGFERKTKASSSNKKSD